MDMISYQAAKRAQKELKRLNSRLGEGIEGHYRDTKTRLEALENMRVGLKRKTITLTISPLNQNGVWTSEPIDLGLDLVQFDKIAIPEDLKDRIRVYTSTHEDEFIVIGSEGEIRSKFDQLIKIRVEALQAIGQPFEMDLSYWVKPLNLRVSEVSANTAINLNKTNLRIASLIHMARYKHKEMIVDDFQDDSGIDYENSINIEYDPDRKCVRVASGKKQGELYIVTETTSTPPIWFALSHVSEHDTRKSLEFDLEKGEFHQTHYTQNSIRIAPLNAELLHAEGEYITEAHYLGEDVSNIRIYPFIDVIEGSSYEVYTATSSDGATFTPFELINQDGSINSPVQPYIKVKIKLMAALSEEEYALEVDLFSSEQIEIRKEDYQLKADVETKKYIRDIQKEVFFDANILTKKDNTIGIRGENYIYWEI